MLSSCCLWPRPQRRKYEVKRSTKFATLNGEDVEYFKKILDSHGLVVDKHDLTPFNVDWMGKYKGNSSLVLRPTTTDQVSKILRYCNERKLAVVPQGGNTGLVGGSVPVFDEIVISLQRMNKIKSFDPISGALVCESGVVLQNIDQYLSQHQYTVPLDLGAKGSCHIGGNVSTNAGGIRFLRYGSLHGSVLGVEAVLADGRIVDNLNTLKKDNTGYDLKQLFIGSEGTLGILTGVSLACASKPKSVNVAALACSSFESAQKVFLAAKRDLGEILSAFEFWDRAAFELLLNKDKRARDPFAIRHPIYLLIETSGSNTTHDKEKMNTFIETIMNGGLIGDGTIANDQSQANDLWHIRDHLAEACRQTGFTYKYDVSLPSEYYYDLVDVMRGRIDKNEATVIGYGHMGDGNLHLNIVSPTPVKSNETFAKIEPFIYEYCAKHRGSISAEHGIGVMKPQALHYSKSPVMIELMQTLKRTLDPNGILNPYKVLP